MKTNNQASNKNDVLKELSRQLERGQLQKKEVLAVLDAVGKKQHKLVLSAISIGRIDLQRIFYYVGGLVLLLGIILYAAQVWEDLGQIGQPLFTLGSAVSLYALGYYFFRHTAHETLARVFLVLSALLFPLGISVALEVLEVNMRDDVGLSLMLALLFPIYFFSYQKMKEKFFLVLAVVAASVLYFSFTNILFGSTLPILHFEEYRFLLLGLGYLIVGYYLSLFGHRFLVKEFNLFGLLLSLGAAFAMQGLGSDPDYLWQTVFPLMLVSLYYLGVKLSRAEFLRGALFFVSLESLRVTEVYNRDVGSGGWGVWFQQYRVLVLGMVLVGVGYYLINQGRRKSGEGLYLIGLLWVMSMAMYLQGYRPSANYFWQILYPFLLSAVYYGSIKLQNRVFLWIATLFTFAEILKITSEYFSQSLGWPVALILAGAAILGMGYFSFEINQRFLKRDTNKAGMLKA